MTSFSKIMTSFSKVVIVFCIYKNDGLTAMTTLTTYIPLVVLLSKIFPFINYIIPI